MRFLLQRPLPDELLSSALMRTCVQFDLSIKVLMTSLHGHGSPPGFFHMSNIGTYSEVLGIDPKRLLLQSTVFPSLIGFQPWERREGYQAEAFRFDATSPYQLSALQSTSLYVPYRRFCLHCARADKARHGWPYWHVTHNLPGVAFCSKHGTRLRETALPTGSGTNRWSYLLPGEGESTLQKRPRTAFELRLHQLALAVQADEFWPALGPLSAGHYRRGLESAGLLAPNRQVSSPAAMEWIRDLVTRTPTCQGLVQADSKMSWVGLLLRHQDQFPFPAFKHLVIQAAMTCAPRSDEPILNHKPKGMSQRDLSDVDAVKAHELDAQIRKLVQSGTRFTLQSLLENLGIGNSFRHKRSRFPRIQKVIELHRRALIQSRQLRRRTAQSKKTDRL